MTRIYLCSRVASDARPLNDVVARYLRKHGYSVFVPHEASYNQVDHPDVTDEDVRRLDMAEMQQAATCVIVGRVGVDCAFEVGWFHANSIPTTWYVPSGVDVGRHPMLSCITRARDLPSVRQFLLDLVHKPALRQKFLEESAPT